MAIFCSEIRAQSQFATISHESCLARFGHVQKLRNIFLNQFWVKLKKAGRLLRNAEQGSWEIKKGNAARQSI